MSIKFYAAVLLACNLVKCNKAGDGGYSVSLNRDEWNKFLSDYGLAEGTKGYCELTNGKIKYEALKDKRRMLTSNKDGKMYLLRIGK